MDRQLASPLLFQTLSQPKKLSSQQTFSHLQDFLPSLPASPSRTQLERLTDALGVECGLILPAEGERREAERLAERARVKAEKRRRREEEKRRAEMEDVEGMVEDLENGVEGEDDVDQGAVEFERDEKMDDRGDVEYGDEAEGDEDEDEPDNADKMEQCA